MVKIVERKLHRLIEIEPIALEQPACVDNYDVIFVFQHPKGNPLSISTSHCILEGTFPKPCIVFV